MTFDGLVEGEIDGDNVGRVDCEMLGKDVGELLGRVVGSIVGTADKDGALVNLAGQYPQDLAHFFPISFFVQ